MNTTEFRNIDLSSELYLASDIGTICSDISTAADNKLKCKFDLSSVLSDINDTDLARLSDDNKVPSTKLLSAYLDNLKIKAASDTMLGGIKLGFQQSLQKYPLETNDEDRAYVEIPDTIANGYMSFDVMPTDVEIPAGTNDNGNALEAITESLSFTRYTHYTNLNYVNAVPANLTCFLEFYIDGQLSDSDISIDWGDNTNLSVLANDKEHVIDDIVVHIRHEYGYSGIHTVKIYGSKYKLVRNSNNYETVKGEASYSIKSIVRSCLESRFGLPNNIINLAAFARNSDRLLKVTVPLNKGTAKVRSWCNLFQDSTNLLVADFADGLVNSHPRESHMIFSGCTSLHTLTGFRMSDYGGDVNGYYKEFYNCSSLTANILDLLPKYGFSQTTLNLYATFMNCSNISCSNDTSLGNILWNNVNQKYTSSSTNCFSGCTSLTLSVIPYELGGTYNKNIHINNNSLKIGSMPNNAYKIGNSCCLLNGEDVSCGSSYAHAEGKLTLAKGYGSHAEGYATEVHGNFSHADGKYCKVNSNNTYAWSGIWTEDNNKYTVDREGTFNINPKDGIKGFYISNDNLCVILSNAIEVHVPNKALSADALTCGNVGSASYPIYFQDGKPMQGNGISSLAELTAGMNLANYALTSNTSSTAELNAEFSYYTKYAPTSAEVSSIVKQHDLSDLNNKSDLIKNTVVDAAVSASHSDKIQVKQLDGNVSSMEIVLCSDIPETYEDGKLYFVVETVS